MRVFLTTYNMLFGYDPRVFDTLTMIKDESEKHDYACVTLQEVRNKTTKDDLAHIIQKLFPGFHAAKLISPKPSLHDMGLMTLSRMPIIDATPILLPKVLKRMPQHAALMTRYAVGKKILRVTNVHFNVFGGIPHKRKQIMRILEYFQLAKADYDIICGDFNTIGPYKLLNKHILKQKNAIQKQLGKTFKEVTIPSWTGDVGDVMSPTTPASRLIYKTFKKTGIQFRQKLDWVFVRGFNTMHADVRHDLKGSDHYPVMASLQFS